MKRIKFFHENKFLVTGSSGFIGTNLINRLKELGSQVLGIDKNEPIIANLDVHENCDLNDYHTLQKIIKGYQPTVIIHLAARTDLDGVCLADYVDNTEAVDNLCKVIIDVDSCKKVLFASSMLVCVAGYAPKSSTDYCPSTIYGESKVITENIINSYAEKLPSHLIFRPTSIWGAYFKQPYKNFFDMVLAQRFVRIGGCIAKKTYGYVENSCNQILSLSLCETHDDVYYIGDEALNANDWSLLIASKANVSKPIQVPFLIIKFAALLGDFLKTIGVKFPITSFRLNNMMTTNIYEPLPVNDINVFDNISVEQGVQSTVEFLSKKG